MGLSPLAHADEFSDCNKSCDLALRIAQCKRIAERTDFPNATRSAAYAKVCYLGLLHNPEVDRSTFEACRMGVELGPTAERHNLFGVAKFKVGAYKGAIKSFDAGIILNPALGALYYNRALAYEKRGDSKAAADDFAQAKLLGE
jgi:tetratricopeptide (TPR) repeat protein